MTNTFQISGKWLLVLNFRDTQIRKEPRSHAMGYRLREFEAERKFSSELTLEAIGQAVPMGELKAVLQEGKGEESR